MKFKYKKYGQNTLRPVIDLKVKFANKEIRYHALVDSGADFCLFHAEVAEVLGINVNKGKKGIVTGVGGKSSQYFIHKVTVEIGGWDYIINVGFLPTIGGRSAPYGIVGQDGFFKHFKVIFDRSNEEIELKNKQ